MCPYFAETRDCNEHACPKDCVVTPNLASGALAPSPCGGGPKALSQTHAAALRRCCVPARDGDTQVQHAHLRAALHCWSVVVLEHLHQVVRQWFPEAFARARVWPRERRQEVAAFHRDTPLQRAHLPDGLPHWQLGQLGHVHEVVRQWLAPRRSRVVRAPRNGGKACPHTAETRRCSHGPCPIHCTPSAPSAPGPRAPSRAAPVASCARARSAPTPATAATCARTSRRRVRATSTHALVDCVPGVFGKWTTCSKSCGTGYQSRSRKRNVSPVNGGALCPHTVETRNCNQHACPTDCRVGTWARWTRCSQTCGGGYHARPLTQPTFGGKGCPYRHEVRTCNAVECPEDCQHSA